MVLCERNSDAEIGGITKEMWWIVEGNINTSKKSSQQFGSWKIFSRVLYPERLPPKLTYPLKNAGCKMIHFLLILIWSLFRIDIPFSSVCVKMRVLPETFSWFQLVFLGCIKKMLASLKVLIFCWRYVHFLKPSWHAGSGQMSWCRDSELLGSFGLGWKILKGWGKFKWWGSKVL